MAKMLLFGTLWLESLPWFCKALFQRLRTIIQSGEKHSSQKGLIVSELTRRADRVRKTSWYNGVNG